MTSISERYTRAIFSSHLEQRVEASDLDTLIAAGKANETLGTSLMRLRAEFDSISTRRGSRHMIPRLHSAHSVWIKLLGLIVARVPHSLDLTQDEAVDMAARLLDHWCDSNCPVCTGRGTIGGDVAPQFICNACGGSKVRSLMWPIELQAFADSIAGEMEMSVDTACRRIRYLLR